VALEIGARARAVRDAAAALAELARPPGDGSVRWIDVTSRGVSLCSAPVDVGPLLRERLFGRVTAVLTSATLSTGRPPSFGFVRERLGLADADELQLGSPFRYEQQARLVLRGDLPDPGAEPEAWEAALPAAIEEAVRESGGGALVLFTALASMRRAAEALRPRIEALGLELLVQGEGLERPALLERLRRGGGVLLGVASFWQGVDVPGDALRHVVIARLPFEVPTHPLAAARRGRVEQQGRDAFTELTLPQAALRLKQGFGRLIRRATDAGTVTILDPRMLTKRYGRFLRDSLPACPVEIRGAPA
jgi:ATP-dependent DNA helicase DinG